MRVPRRDVIATGIVALAVVLYLFWLADLALPGLGAVRATGVILLGLGFVASAVAVVPGFEQLLHGNKTYLVITALLGLAAFGGGLQMLIAASSAGLAVMMAAMVLLWAAATTHHVLLSNSAHGGHVRLAA
jgi:hypothetical protein